MAAQAACFCPPPEIGQHAAHILMLSSLAHPLLQLTYILTVLVVPPLAALHLHHHRCLCSAHMAAQMAQRLCQPIKRGVHVGECLRQCAPWCCLPAGQAVRLQQQQW